MKYSNNLQSLALASLCLGFLSLTSISAQATTVSGFTIRECEENFEEGNFCSADFVKEYKKALKKGANFNEKYALAFIGGEIFEVVAIDVDTKRITTLGVEIEPVGEVEYSLNSDTFCFSGDILGYRQANSFEKVCYQLKTDPSSHVHPDASGMQFRQSLAEF